MAKLSKQERLLKKYSKDGFTKSERKLIAKKLGVKLGQASRLTRAYGKQFKIGGGKTSANKNKSTTNSFGIKSTSYAPGVSAPGVKTPKKSKSNRFGIKSTKYAPGVSSKLPKKSESNPFGVKTTRYAPGVSAPGTKKPKTSKKSLNPFGLPKQDPLAGPLSRDQFEKAAPNLKSIVENIANNSPVTPELTVDPKIGNLQRKVKSANTNLQNLQNTFDKSNLEYQTQIGDLREDISGYKEQIGDYRGQIDEMSDRLLEQAQNARQFKQMDTEYLSNNTASGIRLRRSKKSRSGGFALGTAGLNRKNRSPLKISNVNL